MKRILVYGDSNTFGIGPMPRLSDDVVVAPGMRWAEQMAAALPGTHVVIEGLPGRTTVHSDPIEGAHKNGLAVLPAVIESHWPIDLLIFMLGTNDLKHRFNLMARDVALGVRSLVRCAQSYDYVGQVLVIAPPAPHCAGDFAGIFDGAELRGAGLAAEIERFAGEEGAAFFDAGQVIAVDPVDGLHFDETAHAALGAAVAERARVLLT